MNAFARAAAALHADTNLSVACTWAPGPDRDTGRTLEADLEAETYTLTAPETAIRGIRSQEEAQTFGIGGGAVTPRQRLDVEVAALSARIMRGDIITIGGTAMTVESAERDIEGVTWRLVLSDPSGA